MSTTTPPPLTVAQISAIADRQDQVQAVLLSEFGSRTYQMLAQAGQFGRAIHAYRMGLGRAVLVNDGRTLLSLPSWEIIATEMGNYAGPLFAAADDGAWTMAGRLMPDTFHQVWKPASGGWTPAAVLAGLIPALTDISDVDVLEFLGVIGGDYDYDGFPDPYPAPDTVTSLPVGDLTEDQEALVAERQALVTGWMLNELSDLFYPIWRGVSGRGYIAHERLMSVGRACLSLDGRYLLSSLGWEAVSGAMAYPSRVLVARMNQTEWAAIQPVLSGRLYGVSVLADGWAPVEIPLTTLPVFPGISDVDVLTWLGLAGAYRPESPHAAADPTDITPVGELTEQQETDIAERRGIVQIALRQDMTSDAYHVWRPNGYEGAAMYRRSVSIAAACLAGDGRDLLNGGVWNELRDTLRIPGPTFAGNMDNQDWPLTWRSSSASYRPIDETGTGGWTATAEPAAFPDMSGVSERDVLEWLGFAGGADGYALRHDPYFPVESWRARIQDLAMAYEDARIAGFGTAADTITRTAFSSWWRVWIGACWAWERQRGLWLTVRATDATTRELGGREVLEWALAGLEQLVAESDTPFADLLASFPPGAIASIPARTLLQIETDYTAGERLHNAVDESDWTAYAGVEFDAALAWVDTWVGP